MELVDIKHYEIDFDKVNSIEDIKSILEAMKIVFGKEWVGGIKHLVKEFEKK